MPRQPRAPARRERYSGWADIKIERPAIWLDGGPRDGWVYFADEFDALVRIGLGGYGQRVHYMPTDEKREHPYAIPGPHSTLSVWRYTG